jgi:hypothetical protein
MKLFIECITIFFILFLFGCSGVSKVKYSPLVEVELKPVDINNVKTFLTTKPNNNYEEIGILTYRAGTAESYVDVVKYLKEKAAVIGADGIIMMGSKSGPSVVFSYGVATLTDYQAMAFVYR